MKVETMTKLKEYTSTITVSWCLNNHEAKSKEDYIHTLKLQFKEQYGIDLQDHEIKEIERVA
jgi:hypothetical protein